MQQEFDADFPELGIRIIGVNQFGEESGNSLVDEALPWLQDVDVNGDQTSDVWELWNAEWRDLIIVDRNNIPVREFSLNPPFDLAVPANYAEVRQAFLNAATQQGAAGEGEASFVEAADYVFANTDEWLYD